MPVDAAFPSTRARHEEANRAALAGVFADLRGYVLARFDVNGKPVVSKWWDQRVADIVYERNWATARDVAGLMVAAFPGDAPFDENQMVAWLTENARLAAVYQNDMTRRELDGVSDREGVEHVMDVLEGSRVERFAAGMAAVAVNFAASDAARSQGAATKTWVVNSGNPRSKHRAVRGETVPVGAVFSNRMLWPGDPRGDASQTANCRCSLRYN